MGYMETVLRGKGEGSNYRANGMCGPYMHSPP